MRLPLILAVIWAVVALQSPLVLAGQEDVLNVEKLATSIWHAEGGAKTRHPYGILKRYKTTTPRQACINTIKSGLRRYAVYKGSDDFITFLSKTYAPINAANDPTGLNRNWISNVKFFYNKKGK